MATFPRMTPPIDVEGLFVLRPPFSDLMKPNTIYMVKAIRSFKELFILNIDPYKSYYEPLNIPEADYKDDATSNAHIITLVSKIPFSDTGDNTESVIYVPDTYILQYPNGDMVNYFNFILAVEMGPLPEWFDEADIVNDIQDIVRAKTGLFIGSTPNPIYASNSLTAKTDVRVFKNSYPSVISSTDSTLIEQVRLAAVEDKEPTVTKYRLLQEQYDLLLAQYNALAQSVIDTQS